MRGRARRRHRSRLSTSIGPCVDDDVAPEFDRLLELGLVTPATVIIHGTALTEAQLAVVTDRGAKLGVAEEQPSPLRPDHARVARVRSAETRSRLVAQRQPGLLDAIKIARLQLAQQGAPASAERRSRCVTTEAAHVAA